MKIIKMLWKPTVGDDCYYMSAQQPIGYYKINYDDSKYHKTAFKRGYIVETREDAKHLAIKIGWLND